MSVINEASVTRFTRSNLDQALIHVLDLRPSELSQLHIEPWGPPFDLHHGPTRVCFTLDHGSKETLIAGVDVWVEGNCYRLVSIELKHANTYHIFTYYPGEEEVLLIGDKEFIAQLHDKLVTKA